jgi:hypothetical protein
MEVTYTEIVLLVIIAILFVIIAKQQAHIKMLIFAGTGLTQALRSIAEGTGQIVLTKDDDLLFKKVGGNDDTSKQD